MFCVKVQCSKKYIAKFELLQGALQLLLFGGGAVEHLTLQSGELGSSDPILGVQCQKNLLKVCFPAGRKCRFSLDVDLLRVDVVHGVVDRKWYQWVRTWW